MDRESHFQTIKDLGLGLVLLKPNSNWPVNEGWSKEPPADFDAAREWMMEQGGNVGFVTGPSIGSETPICAIVGALQQEPPFGTKTWQIKGKERIWLFKSPDVCPKMVSLKDGYKFLGEGCFVPAPGSVTPEMPYVWTKNYPFAKGVVLEDLPQGAIDQIIEKTGPTISGGNMKPGGDTALADGAIQVGLDLTKAVTVAEDVLAQFYGPERDRAVYQKPGCLVVLEGTRGDMNCMRLGHSVCREMLAGAVRWVDEASGQSILPPKAIVSPLIHRGKWKNIPKLDKVLSAPCVLPDGKILLREGYIPEIKAYADFDPEPYKQHIRTLRGKGSAALCADAVLQPFENFPFISKVDRATLLALILTLVGREAIDGEVPMFAVRSPVRGTGKTLLGRSACLAATGCDPSLQQTIKSQDEIRKNLFATAMGGERVCFFDNEEGTFGSPTLSSCITSGYIEDRKLGASEKVKVKWSAVCLVTGNNLTFRDDLGRRTLTIDLDCGLQRPESRDPSGFLHSPLVPYIRENQPYLYMAAASIIEQFIKEGKPRQVGRGLGGFEAWDTLIRQAVIWAIGDDPVHAWDERDEDDADIIYIQQLQSAWKGLFALDHKVSISDIACQARLNPDLEEALQGVAAKKFRITVHTVGRAFRKVLRRPVDGLVFRKVFMPDRRKGVILEKVGNDPLLMPMREDVG
jgi:hypothetical protein